MSKNVLYRVSEKYQKYQINKEPNYDSCNRILMWSSYCENFIYISLSIAMWHGIFENWRITKMPFQRERSILKTLHKQTGALNSSFSREKSTLAEQYLAWTTVWIIKRWKEFKLLKTGKEQSRKSKTTHKRVQLPNYPLQRQSHPFEQMERSALSLKEYNIFWYCKKSKFIILLIFVPISRVVVTL